MQRRELLRNAGMLAAVGLGAAGASASGIALADQAAEAAPTPGPLYEPHAGVIHPFIARTDRITRLSVCTRPFRAEGPRIELEKIAGRNVVHNYGTGGSGWSLSWGCAIAVLDIVRATHVRDVAVVGCGALGLTAAVHMVRSGLRVRIYTRERIADTRSYNATGVWSPSSRVGTAEKCDPVRWEELCRNSFRMYQSLIGLPGDPVQWIDSYALSDGNPDREAPAVPPATESTREPVHFAEFDERTSDLIPGDEVLPVGSHPFPVPDVRRSATMMYNIPAYMNFLEREFLLNGGHIEYLDLQSPHDFARIPERTIVNATGYGARALLRDDSLIPVRGQLGHMVPQHELDYALSYRNAYLTPRRDGLVVQNNHSEMDGYGDPSVIPDRAESEEVIRILGGVFSRMRQPA